MRLKRDSLEADLAPALGGAIAAFRVGGRPIFREPAPGARDVTDLGEFPMAPYVNRIAHGQFRWRNEGIALPRNRAEQAHPLHGIGWQREWICERLGPHAARMTLSAAASADWPWAVTMERVVTLVERGLEVAFSLTNDDARPMPASIGLHPYFYTAGARVRLACEVMWQRADDIPTARKRTPVVDALAVGAAVKDLDVDNCFAGWDGVAEIDWPDLTLRIETDPPQRFVQLYTPPGEDWFCLEPQSAMPDAVNRSPEEGGVVELAPGVTLAFETRFIVSV
jgi:aldose 1-epimerase